MHNMPKNLRKLMLYVGCGALLSSCSAMNKSYYGKQNQAKRITHHNVNMAPYHARHKKKSGLRGLFDIKNPLDYDIYRNGLPGRIKKEKFLRFQRPAPIPHPLNQFQRWDPSENEYKLYPGDQLDIVVQSAPELSRTLTVGPDGRVVMPMLDPIMAAGRPISALTADLKAGLGQQLRDPTVAVSPRAYAQQQIFIGGQVGAPGTYAIPGPIGAIEAVFMAGGFAPGAQSQQVAVLRRRSNGAMMLRTVNIQNGLRNIREYNDNIQLQRGDIIFVPRTNLAELGQWMQDFRRTWPIDLNLSYQFGGGGNNTTIVGQ